MFRDLEILAISCTVGRETRPRFILFYEAIWVKFVYDFIGHNIPIKANYVFYIHPRIVGSSPGRVIPKTLKIVLTAFSSGARHM